MARRKVLIPIGAVVILGGLLIANLSGRGEGAQEVKTEEVKRRSLETWVRAPGRVEPVVSVDVSSNVTGRVQELRVSEGDAVIRGQLLLTLDDTRYRSAVEQYQAMLGSARSNLLLAEAQRDLARQVLQRREELFSGGLLSSEELEAARVDLRVKDAQVAAQRDEVARLQAGLREAERNLEETRFLAPMDGVITALNLEEGENVLIGTMNNPGTVILTLADLRQMEVEARVNEADVVLLAPGQAVKIEVDARPGSTLEGTVTRVGESGTRLSRDEGAEFEVDIEISAPPTWLRPGMSADVEILVAASDSALAIPIQSLVARNEETVLRWERRREEAAASGGEVEDSDSVSEQDDEDETGVDPKTGELTTGVFVETERRARFRRIETGVRGESFVQVLSGLEEDEVVVSGPYRVLRRLRDGALLKPSKRKGD